MTGTSGAAASYARSMAKAPPAKVQSAHLQNAILNFVLLDALNGAFSLAQRTRDAAPLKAYLRERTLLIVPVVALMAIVSICCAASMVMFLGGTSSLLVLLSMLLVPFVLVGSFFVQAYVFFSWLEARALAKALHHGTGPLPVPWVLAAIFLVVPLAMLVTVSPLVGITLILLLVAAPFGFARLDR